MNAIPKDACTTIKSVCVNCHEDIAKTAEGNYPWWHIATGSETC